MSSFKEATDLLGMRLEDVAAEIGRSYHTVVAYRAGEREVPPDVMQRVAKLAEKRSRELSRLAERLRR